MSENFNRKPLAFALGATFAAAISVSPVASADTNPFGMQDLGSGYMQLAEGKCGDSKKAGETKCGANKKEEAKGKKDGKCGQAKCGANKAKMEEGKCGANKPRMEEGKCGANKPKMEEGKCGGKS